MKTILLIFALVFTQGCAAAIGLSALLNVLHEVKQDKKIEALEEKEKAEEEKE